MRHTLYMRALAVTTMLLALGPLAGAQAQTDDIARLVEVLDGTKVPLKNNTEKGATSDLHKVTSLAILGPFVFAVSYYGTTICVFERDPATARLTFKTSFENPDKVRWRAAQLYPNELPGGELVLYYWYHGAIHWYRVDRKTGASEHAGKLEGVGSGPAIFAPGRQRMIALGNEGVVLKFDAQGVPAIERKRGTAAAAARFAPDGKHFYEATHTNILVSSYDAATGATTPLSTLELAGHVDNPGNTFLSVSPDGRNIYVGQVNREYGGKKRWFSWMLERDAASGALTVKSSGEPSFDLTQAENCFFSPDGTCGYYIQDDPKDTEGYRARPAWFARDPATGVLTFRNKGPNARNCCMDYDPVNGNFYVGACGQDPQNSKIYVVKAQAFPAARAGGK